MILAGRDRDMISVDLYFRSEEDCCVFVKVLEEEIRWQCGGDFSIRRRFPGRSMAQDPPVNMLPEGECFPDLIIYGLEKKEDIAELTRLRRSCPDAEILIAAEDSPAPTDYVIPGIRPAALVIRPFEGIRNTVGDLVRLLLTKRMEEGRYMRVLTGKVDYYIPWRSILYIEAGDKVVSLYCEGRTITFYGSLREIEKDLPPTFFRCHRRYIVHRIFVETICLSSGSLTVRGGRVIPVSRRCGRILKKQMAADGPEDNRKKEGLTP